MNLRFQKTRPLPGPVKVGRVPWIRDDAKVSETALIKLAAEPGRVHVLVSLHASFSRLQGGLLTICEGSRHAKKQYVHTVRDINFGEGLRLGPGQEMLIGLSFHGKPQDRTEATLLAIGYTDDEEERA